MAPLYADVRSSSCKEDSSCYPLIHDITLHYITLIRKNVAYVAGVRRGRGNLGARERVGHTREKRKERVVNSLPLPF